MNLTNGTDIDQSHKGAFNDFWSFMANFTFKGLPLTFLYLIGGFTFVGAIIFQPILLMAMMIRPNATNNTSDSAASTDNQRSIFEPFIVSAQFINRAFGGKNERSYIIARTLGYIGGFAAGGHIINNMDNDGSSEFVVKSVLLFDGITLASATASNYLLGAPLNKCPQILTRFKDSRNLSLQTTLPEETDELMPIRQHLDDSRDDDDDLEASISSGNTSSTLSLTGH